MSVFIDVAPRLATLFGLQLSVSCCSRCRWILAAYILSVYSESVVSDKCRHRNAKSHIHTKVPSASPHSVRYCKQHMKITLNWVDLSLPLRGPITVQFKPYFVHQFSYRIWLILLNTQHHIPHSVLQMHNPVSTPTSRLSVQPCECAIADVPQHRVARNMNLYRRPATQRMHNCDSESIR